ncbi:Mycocerosic acid synthase [Micromonospora sp. MH33]|uniref:beta-ketoacyl synthase N-terminal-like domain-containing protein n=1 Tax=Micromonospora sp. MH33 TaxID=1945509 RepID=UPI000D149274|nr:polyketide synthase [Micromonospora sp. MH33]PSK66856.1 Mycocerosic acid synthase [Micromonospora sp. MH33]
MRSARRQAGEAIAVIGVGCRLPGAPDATQLWRHLLDGRDLITEVPADRFRVDDYVAPFPPPPGRTTSRWGGFVDGVAEFDGGFFGIDDDEAASLDPQQRLLLMSAWEALEDAGQLPEYLAGSRTSVFVGQSQADYWDLQSPRLDRLGLASVLGGQQRGMAAGRLSYAFDLRGPSLTVDAAQASSGVAVHLAAQSLRSGESTMAVVAGVNLVLTPTPAVMFGQAGVLAADGRCKFGDSSADGFVRSDGVVVVVLKPLTAALADRDRVRAVLLGSAVSNDGRAKPELTAPSVTGQTAAMRAAYAAAGVSPADVDYVEAHGTGTRIDAAELAALIRVLAEGRPAGRPCLVGSVKTNIGHTEAAAGLAGLLKAVLCLEHGLVPPSLHCVRPRVDVDWDRVPLVVPDVVTPLPDHGRPTIVAVNGQSMSGANVHLVLAQAADRAGTCRPTGAPGAAGDRCSLVLSARTPDGLTELIQRYLAFLAPGGAGAALDLRDICYSTNVRRRRYPHQVIVQGCSHDDMIRDLRAVLSGGPGETAETPGDVGPAGRLVSLPPRPWQTTRHWLDQAAPPSPLTPVGN